jgi:hypothetical protein
MAKGDNGDILAPWRPEQLLLQELNMVVKLKTM